MRQSWTDDRLDDLNVKVDRGFEQVDQRFEQVDRRFDEVDKRFDKVDRRLEKVQDEFVAVRKEMKEGFEAMQRLLIQTLIGVVTFMAAGFGIVATLLSIS